MKRTVITGTGSFIPELVKKNRDFAVHDFFDENKKRIETDPTIVVEKFRQITGIAERRYAMPDLTASDIGYLAGLEAIRDSGINPEELGQLIVAHNFGDVIKYSNQTDILPALASRIKNKLAIKNPYCVAYDILFGCPGWVQGLIQADAFMKAQLAEKCLVIGTETLSRVLDVYDRDSMIFSDGAGAAVVEFIDVEGEQSAGILSTASLSHCEDETFYLYLGESNFPHSDPRLRYIKMKGRKIYEYALNHVPAAMKECLDKADVSIDEVKMVFLHQANEKMDEAIMRKLFKLYGKNELRKNIMPMNIHTLGNSSVATVPTLFDRVSRGEMDGYSLQQGDIVLFASVGAGMNISAICYRI